MTTPDKITIRYERSGRCFWHIGCKARHHSQPMRVASFKEQDRCAAALFCVACGEGGWYPHGSVGDMRCERINPTIKAPTLEERIAARGVTSAPAGGALREPDSREDAQGERK
jgi:Ni,Fe-hydrogenase I small subunit